MGISNLPATSASTIPGVGSVVASGTSSKGYVQFPLAAGNYVCYVNSESPWSWHAPKSGTYGAGNVTAVPAYINITTSETIFTLGTRPINQVSGLQSPGSLSTSNAPITFNGANVITGVTQSSTVSSCFYPSVANGPAYLNSQSNSFSTMTGFTASTPTLISYANNAYFAIDPTNAKIFRSTNGTAWTSNAVTGFVSGGASYGAVIYGSGNNYYLAVGQGGGTATSQLASSTDGITWSTRNSASGSNNLFAIAYGNNTYVATGASGQIVSSTDSITWASRTVASTQNFYGVAHNGTRFVAFGDFTDATVSYAPGSNIAYSTDGTTWTMGSISLSPQYTGTTGFTGTQTATRVTTIGSTFVAIITLTNGSAVAYSSDGINWGIVVNGATNWGNSLYLGASQTSGTATSGLTGNNTATNVGNVNGSPVFAFSVGTNGQPYIFYPSPFSYTIYAVTNSTTN